MYTEKHRNNKNFKKKKVIIQILRSANYGGVENHVYTILKNIDQSKFHPILISLTNAPINCKFRKLPIEIYSLYDSEDQSFKAIINIIYLIKLLKQLNPDIIHLHGVRPIFVGSIASLFLLPCKIISTMHGSYTIMSIDLKGNINNLLLNISKVMHLIGFMISKNIILDCNYLRNEVLEIYKILPFIKLKKIESKVSVIYSGIDSSKNLRVHKTREIKSKIGIKNSYLIFGIVSRLDEPKKGISMFLKSASLFLNNGRKANFIITGEGYSKKYLVEYTKELGIQDNVFFTGYWQDLSEIFSILDVFVMPSLSEGFPIVNLEAMSYGIPIIATNVGGNSEAILNNFNGIILSQINEFELFSAMMFLSKNKSLRKKMGDNGKKQVKKFDEKIMLDKIYNIYDIL